MKAPHSMENVTRMGWTNLKHMDIVYVYGDNGFIIIILRMHPNRRRTSNIFHFSSSEIIATNKFQYFVITWSNCLVAFESTEIEHWALIQKIFFIMLNVRLVNITMNVNFPFSNRFDAKRIGYWMTEFVDSASETWFSVDFTYSAGQLQVG